MNSVFLISLLIVDYFDLLLFIVVFSLMYCTQARNSPLICAARTGHGEIIRMFLDKGADVNARDREVREITIKITHAISLLNFQL